MDMPTLENIPASQDIVIILGVSASLVWAWTEWAKATLKGLKKDGPDSWKWQQGMRALAALFGCVAGFLVGGWPWGIILGLVGAANSALFVKIGRARAGAWARAIFGSPPKTDVGDVKPHADEDPTLP